MQRKSFLKQFRFILPIGLAILLISSPTSAQVIYSVDLPKPSYVEANTVLSSLTGRDEAIVRIRLPFSFNFYKDLYTDAYVSTNGYLSFVQGNSAYYYNTNLPTTDLPNGAIYAFWDNLVVDSDASVRTQLLGTAPNQRFVIEWRNVTFYRDNSRRVDFEIVLHENGVILLQYRNIANDGREMGYSATVGLEDKTGTSAVEFSSYKAAIRPGEFAIRFAYLARPVPVDIKPVGCPNPLNVGSKGVLPVAILGTSDLDVTAINPKTVTLGGGVILSMQEDPSKTKKKIKILVSNLSPLRWSFEDVGTPYQPFAGKIDPYQCNALGPDGHSDIVFKFDTQAIAASLSNVEDGEVITLQLSGQLLDGTEISGEDVVIIKKGKEK